jgi:hypothetical protein
MALLPLVPGRVWHARQPLAFGPIAITARMTVVKLADGALWVHSPITPSAELVRAIEDLGEVRYVVAPNRAHHLFFLPFLDAFPNGAGYIAPGLGAKRPDLAQFPELPAPEAAPWSPELPSFFIEGLPVLNETVWFDRPSRTLILTDLLFCFGQENRLLARMVARGLGVYERLGMSRTMKLMVKDKAALRKSVAPLLELDVERIVVAHDQIIEHDARARLAAAFAWLG